MSKELRIVYMGTPEFAVPSLEILIDKGYSVVAVITAPDKPKGRGQKLAMSPVKECAVKHDIPVLQPTNLKSPEFISELKSYNANLQIIVAFRMLPEIVWDMPEIGTFNLHASLLPKYRGAAPINWAIMNGEEETGVTTFFLKHEIDTGNIVFQEKEPIGPDDTVGDLYTRLMEKGSKLVLKTVEAITNDNYSLKDQGDANGLPKAPKIYRETCEINWDQPTTEVHNFIRGLSPYPAAWTTLEGNNLKIYKAHLKADVDGMDHLQPGKFHTDNKSFWYYKTSDGVMEVLELQLQGKKRMKTADFLRGYDLKPN